MVWLQDGREGWKPTPGAGQSYHTTSRTAPGAGRGTEGQVQEAEPTAKVQTSPEEQEVSEAAWGQARPVQLCQVSPGLGLWYPGCASQTGHPAELTLRGNDKTHNKWHTRVSEQAQQRHLLLKLRTYYTDIFLKSTKEPGRSFIKTPCSLLPLPEGSLFSTHAGEKAGWTFKSI